MQDFSFVNKMTENEAYLFKRCIRRLLDVTFILEEKEERLYRFIAEESNLYNVNAYLSLMGYQVVLSERLKVAMLQPNDEDRETVGLKVVNLYHFDQKEMRLLIVLWLLFLERMGYEEAVYVTVGEIIDKCHIYQISLTPAEFKHAYRIFRRFSLIDYSDDIDKEDGKVRLYPSLQFCMDVEQLKQVMEEYTQEDSDAEETELSGLAQDETAEEEINEWHTLEESEDEYADE